MIIHYQNVIIMMAKKKECDQSHHRIITQDCSQDYRTPREQSIEDKGHVPIERKHVQQITRHHKWMTGRSAVTVHR